MRISKLRSSTVRCARSMAFVTIFASSGTSSGNALPITQFIAPGREQPHQLVLEREVEAALARVALAAGAASQLVVDAAALVALGAEHVEAAELADLVAVGRALAPGTARPAPGSCSGASSGVEPSASSSWRARPSGLPPSRMSTPRPAMFVATVTACGRPAWVTITRFLLVLLGVQHRMRDAPLLEQPRQLLGLLDRDRADEHGLAGSRSARRCRRRQR